MIFYVFLKKISHQNQNIILKKFKGQRIIEWKNWVHKRSIKENFIEELKSPKTINYPDFTVNYDASEQGLWAVLSQEQNGQMNIP